MGIKRINSFIEKGHRIYKRLRSELEQQYKGKIIAIEVKSGKYVIADDELEAAISAKKKFPHKKFSFFRIGYPVIHKFRKM